MTKAKVTFVVFQRSLGVTVCRSKLLTRDTSPVPPPRSHQPWQLFEQSQCIRLDQTGLHLLVPHLEPPSHQGDPSQELTICMSNTLLPDCTDSTWHTVGPSSVQQGRPETRQTTKQPAVEKRETAHLWILCPTDASSQLIRSADHTATFWTVSAPVLHFRLLSLCCFLDHTILSQTHSLNLCSEAGAWDVK